MAIIEMANSTPRASVSVGILKNFIPARQLRTILSLAKGEEGAFFVEKMQELTELINKMPKATAKKQDIAYLHYFAGSADWWITGKDFKYDENPEAKQFQAFGKADLFGDGSCERYGYISIEEMLDSWAELDLHWTPKPVKECGRGR